MGCRPDALVLLVQRLLRRASAKWHWRERRERLILRLKIMGKMEILEFSSCGSLCVCLLRAIDCFSTQRLTYSSKPPWSSQVESGDSGVGASGKRGAPSPPQGGCVAGESLLGEGQLPGSW